MNRADSAADNLAGKRLNCAQSVLTAFSDELGLENDLARKIALGFGGGMGHTGKTCGAVTGAFMVIGLKYGNQTAGNAQEVKEKVYDLVKEFSFRFGEIHGTTECEKLLGCDLSTAENVAAARGKGLFNRLCPGFVRDAVNILESMEK